jgi:hypothetical protein
MRARGLALAMFLVASAARAQTAADIATARDLFREGMELRAQNKLSEALAKLKAAHDLYETPPSALELGRAQIDVGQLTEGYETLLSIERISTAKESERSKQARIEAKDLAERTKVRIPTLRIDVSGVSEGLVVTLDGVVVAPSLFGIARKVDPGHHVVVSRSAAGTERKTELDVVEAQAATATVDASVDALSAQAGVVQALSSPPRVDRFSVLYKFLPPSQQERWSLHAKNGSIICALPCEQWLGEHTGAYLERAPTTDDRSPRRVDVPELLPATIGSTVTARPHAGKGSTGLSALGGVFAGTGALGVIGGAITLLVGAIDWANTTNGSNTGRDTAIAGGVITGVSAALLVAGIFLNKDNYAPHMDYSVAP